MNEAITDPQKEYLEILLNDCGFLERRVRNHFLTQEVGREIRYLDSLTKTEATRLISDLKDRRDDSRPRKDAESEEETLP